MANILIQSPFEYLTDRNGRALANGKIYIGEPDKDPENFPVAAFFDVAGTIPAPQPIRTNSAGFPCDASGNPQRIYTATSYSIRVSDQNGAQIIYAADAADGFYGVIASDLANQVDPDLGTGMVGWVYQPGATGSTLHDKLSRGWVDVKDFGAVGDNLANDKAAFDAAASTGRSILLPAGTYNVPTGDYTGVRFYSFDGATVNNGTIQIVDPLSTTLSVGIEASFSCAPESLPFGWVPLNGNLLNRTVYPELWAFANASGNIVDEADKPANPGAWGRGNGTTTFSAPDKRGTTQGYADASASVDTSLVLGKRVAKSYATGALIDEVIVSTPAVRAFATATATGSIDIQELQIQVTQNTTDIAALEVDKAPLAGGAIAWGFFNGDPMNGTYSQSGLTITVTMTAHGMATGDKAYLDFTTGTAVDGYFTVTITGANTFTVQAVSGLTTSGNVTRTVAVFSSYNIESIIRTNTGRYNVTFTNDAADDRFVVVANGMVPGASPEPRFISGYAKTPVKFSIACNNSSAAFSDFSSVDFTVFGVLA